MVQRFLRWRFRKSEIRELFPDETLPEAHYLTTSDEDLFRVEVPISRRVPLVFLGCFITLLGVFGARSFWLQGVEGATYRRLATENLVASAIVPAPRGTIVDREGRLLAGNATTPQGNRIRVYTYPFSLAHLVGYVSPPKKDASGFYYQWNYEGVAGIERAYNALLQGEDGIVWYETDAKGAVVSQRIVRQPKEAPPLQLTIDAPLTEALYQILKETAEQRGFRGASGALLDVRDGSVLAITSYPSFDHRPFGNPASTTEVARELARPNAALLPRAWSGRYAPGSTIKPFVAVSALANHIITPSTVIVSNGTLVVPNPYHPDKPTVYRDWGPPAFGANNLSRALAFSSNVFFMSVAGGNPKAGIPRGIGIQRLAKDLAAFGFTESFPFAGSVVPAGTIPTPEWKRQTFGTPWRLGDTYLTAIGQFGVQVTPLALARAAAGIATGKLPFPCLTQQACAAHAPQPLPFEEGYLAPVRQGMRRAVQEGTAKGLNLPFVTVAAKTGTAELGASHKRVNSLVIGFFPYENPRYAFAVVMERGPASNTIGGVYVMARLFQWMRNHAPSYLSDTVD